MQRRPQARVGEALVVAEIMLRRHVDGRQRAGAERLDLGERILVLRGVTGMATGADPDGAGFLDHRDQGCRQSSGNRLIRLRPRDAVGNDDDIHDDTTCFRLSRQPVWACFVPLTVRCSEKACDSRREPLTAVLRNFWTSRSWTLGPLCCSAAYAAQIGFITGTFFVSAHYPTQHCCHGCE